MKTPAATCLAAYLAAVSIITFALFGLDKLKALRGSWRIREKTLLLFSLFGGAAGGLLAMFLFRHKIRKPAFFPGLLMMLFLHIILLTLYFKWF
ncbi:MAG: DUF1294 domain-containing protein [Lachnospiraceae bacterium]|nr:DUF1294 domain-containing protein [Lachnospiraceae bacterium]